MNFVEAIKLGFSNYVTFSGRAVRWEYWFWVLFTAIGAIIAMIIDAVALGYSPGSASPVVDLFDLVTFLPSLAVGARRLHDTDRTAWWLLLCLPASARFC